MRGQPYFVAEESVVLGAQSEVLHRVAACPGRYDIDCYFVEKEPLEELCGCSVLCPFLLSASMPYSPHPTLSDHP